MYRPLATNMESLEPDLHALQIRKVLTLICMRYKYGKSRPWFACAINTESLDPNCLKQGKRSPTSHARSYRSRATNMKFFTLICMRYKHGRPSSLHDRTRLLGRTQARHWSLHGDDRRAPHSSSPCTIEPPLLLPRRVVEKQQQWIIHRLPTCGCTCGYIIDRRKVAARSPPRAVSLPRAIFPPQHAPSSGLCARAVILPVRHVHCRLHDVMW